MKALMIFLLDCLNCASTHKLSLYFIFFEVQPVYHEA